MEMQLALPSIFLLSAFLAFNVAQGAVLKSELAGGGRGWTNTGAAPARQKITLTIALKQRNEQIFYERLNRLADPTHALYTKWMDKTEQDDLLKPQPESKSSVHNWLQENDVTILDESDDFRVRFETDIATANKMIDARYDIYKQGHIKKIRTSSYSVPDHLDQYIDIIWPTTYLGNTQPESVYLSQSAASESVKHSASQASSVDPSCDTGLTLACVRSYYGFGSNAIKNAGSKVAIASFVNDTAVQSDFDIYAKANKIPARKISKVFFNGATEDISRSYEGNGNSQILGGLTSPLPITGFSTGGLAPYIPNVDMPEGQNTNEPWLDYLDHLLAKENSDIPQVISHSYADQEVTVPKDYAIKVCNSFAKLGARGITVLISVGDIGVGASCKTAKNATRFNPSDCPYVISVGGTAALDSKAALSYSNEGAWTGSAGGFSDFFERPSYQSTAVKNYLDNYSAGKQKAYACYVNFTGRAQPDVSALAGLPGYAIFDGGLQSLAGGTSSSTPLWGAIFGLLNNARLAKGKKTLGFATPFLYSKAAIAGIRDITRGASIGCNGVNQQFGQPLPDGAIVRGAAWNATTGWDPSTGLGVPASFNSLLEAALAV